MLGYAARQQQAQTSQFDNMVCRSVSVFHAEHPVGIIRAVGNRFKPPRMDFLQLSTKEL